jgi:hypothetical protein
LPCTFQEKENDMKTNTPEKILVGELTYVRQDSAGEWTLFIIDNGWVLIGKDGGLDDEGGRIIRDPWNVRTFGDGEGITAITNTTTAKYDKWPAPATVIDKGRTLSRTTLAADFSGPA